MSTRTFDQEYIENELKKVDSQLHESVVVYIAGGFILAHSALKPRTKDIDVVTEGRRSVDALLNALKKLEYGEPDADIDVSGRVSYVMIENRDTFRWDIFDTIIAGKLTLSEKMKKRAGVLFKGKRLTTMGLTREDVFLLKSVANREEGWERDLEDMALLARTGLNYDIVFEECTSQSELTGKFWEEVLYDRCVELTEYGVEVPILGRLKRIIEHTGSQKGL